MVALFHTISKVDFQHLQKCCSISSGWLVLLVSFGKLVISLNLPWHRDVSREPNTGILIEAAEKGDFPNTD